MPRVFISYAHDDSDHADSVHILSDRLRYDGIEAMFDGYVEHGPPEGFPRWAERSIREADFVLAITSPTYRRRWEGEPAQKRSLGAAWEAHLLAQMLYESPDENEKVIPVLLHGMAREELPKALCAYRHYDYPREYEPLLRRLTHQPRFVPPEVGRAPALPSSPGSRLGNAAAGGGSDEDVSSTYDGTKPTRALWRLTLEADNLSDPELYRILDVLKSISGEPSLQLVRVLRGSVILEIDAPAAAIERLQELATAGTLSEEIGHPVLRAGPPLPRVLVVDDNEDAADMLALVLRKHGYTVDLAYDGEEAVKAAEERWPEIVLLDIAMPGLNGYEVAQWLRARAARMQLDRGAGGGAIGRQLVVAVTGYGQPGDRRRSREAGMDFHIVKPVKPADLFPVLQAHR